MTTETIELDATQRAGFATDRVYRMLSAALALASLILLGLNIPTAVQQSSALGWVWIGFSIGAAGIPPVILLTVARQAAASTLSRLWALSAIALLAAYATAPLGVGHWTLSAATGLPWLVQLAILAGCAGALAFPMRYAVGYGVLLQVAVFNLVRIVAEPFPGQAFGEALEQLFFVTFFTCLAIALRRAGTLLDRSISSAVTEAEASAAAENRRSARQRLEMLVHDRVIAALLSYASGARPAQAADEAQAALAAIGNTAVPAALDEERSPLALIWDIQALTTQHDPDAVFEDDVSSDLPIPAGVAVSVAEATSEALRNSVRHAPKNRAVDRQVRVVVTDELLEVDILDNGAGFNVDAVNPARLGIRSGIVGRMRAVRGGDARVSSTAGYGTTVVLRWRRP